MWYKKKRFVAAVITALLVAAGAALNLDLTLLEEPVIEAGCQAIQCVE